MIVAPSVLSLDYDKFMEELTLVNKSCEWIHYDVMDGHFVPNLSFGPKILTDFRRNTNLLLDVHLMVSDPDYYTDVFAKAGADAITFHVEALNSIDECKKLIKKIHSLYLKAGISIKPNTSVEEIVPLLEDLDIVLVMSVEPGFGGQSFMPSCLEKIKTLKKLKEENNYKYLISDDGGVSDKNAFDLTNAGCDVLVAGSYIFKGDILNNVEQLRKCEKK